jgi:hypothetical protein
MRRVSTSNAALPAAGPGCPWTCIRKADIQTKKELGMNHTVRTSLLLFASVAALLGAAYVSQALSRPDPWKAPTKFEFEYRVDFSELDVKPDQQLRVWIPYPRENQDQRLGDASLDIPWPHQISTDARGNRMIHFEGRGIPSQPFVMRLVVERQPSAGIRVGEIDSDSFDAPDAYLKAAKLIPLGGIIGRLAEQQSKGHETDSAQVRAFYDYVVKNMRYNKDGSGWGQLHRLPFAVHRHGPQRRHSRPVRHGRPDPAGEGRWADSGVPLLGAVL